LLLATAYGLRPGEIDGASFASLLGADCSPRSGSSSARSARRSSMQALICSGSPLSGGGGSAMQQFYMLHQLAFIVKSLKTGDRRARARRAGCGRSQLVRRDSAAAVAATVFAFSNDTTAVVRAIELRVRPKRRCPRHCGPRPNPPAHAPDHDLK
jgi:hypothetical protein